MNALRSQYTLFPDPHRCEIPSTPLPRSLCGQVQTTWLRVPSGTESFFSSCCFSMTEKFSVEEKNSHSCLIKRHLDGGTFCTINCGLIHYAFSSPRNEHAVINNSPSWHSDPVWLLQNDQYNESPSGSMLFQTCSFSSFGLKELKPSLKYLFFCVFHRRK